MAVCSISYNSAGTSYLDNGTEATSYTSCGMQSNCLCAAASNWQAGTHDKSGGSLNLPCSSDLQCSSIDSSRQATDCCKAQHSLCRWYGGSSFRGLTGSSNDSAS